MNATAGKRWAAIDVSRQVIANVVRDLGVTCRRAGELLRCSASTVSAWMQRAARAAIGTPYRRPGRPTLAADRLARNDVYATLQAHGGRISDQELKQAYPDVGRAELRRLKARWRRLSARLRRRRLEQLTWECPGAIWAMDFAELPGGIEDLGKHLLVVRDLASGAVLEAAACRAQDAAHVVRVLRRLFAEHGAPLVLKSDNGSAFVSHAAQALLAAHGVLPLFSPPGTPAYNGGCEAGVGSVKSRAVAIASMRGVDCGVTLDDLHDAVAQSNAQPIARRAGSPLRGPTWLARAPLTAAMRAGLCRRVERHRGSACRARGIAWGADLPHHLRASIDRFAIGRALRELRFLSTRRADFAA